MSSPNQRNFITQRSPSSPIKANLRRKKPRQRLTDSIIHRQHQKHFRQNVKLKTHIIMCGLTLIKRTRIQPMIELLSDYKPIL